MKENNNNKDLIIRRSRIDRKSQGREIALISGLWRIGTENNDSSRVLIKAYTAKLFPIPQCKSYLGKFVGSMPHVY